jgi:putative membrane protein
MPPLPTLLGNLLRGLLMGAADVVPGVSGGTVALIVGIYERLVRSVALGASAAFRFIRLDIGGGMRRLRDIEWSLVLPLGLGILAALVIGSRIIPDLLDRYPEQIRALFFGLILGSLAIPFRRIGRVRLTDVALIGAFAIGAFVLVGLPPREIDDVPLYLVVPAAAIAICAMILPGVSGAFLLLAMGIYRPTLVALAGFNLPYIVAFVGGAAVGLALFSKVLEWLLEHRHAATMAALVGLMAGSLRALWPWLDEDRGLLAPPDGPTLLLMAALALTGFVVVSGVAWLARPRGDAALDAPPSH